jgi:glycosyltransferase involved in cell wall biosynthesis
LTKVLHIITGLSTGGAERMLLKLLTGMNRQQFELSVVSLTTEGELGPSIRELGIPLVTLGMRPGRATPLDLLRLGQAIRRISPNVVQTWMYHADLLGGFAARLVGVPTVCWNIRHSNFDMSEDKWHTRQTARACAWVSRWLPKVIVCNSRNAAAIHQQLGYEATKFRIIPNGFDPHQYRPDPEARASVREELGLKHDAILVGLIARFNPQKNHLGFIEAASRLLDQAPDVHLVLVGKNIDENNVVLRRWIHEKGKTERFHLLGLRPDIARLTAALDVAVSSSSHGEGFPNVVGEAMATGVPCVVTDVGDSSWIVGDTGNVVPPGESVALCAALYNMVSKSREERVKIGEMARRRIIEHFSLEYVVGEYERLYGDLG